MTIWDGFHCRDCLKAVPQSKVDNNPSIKVIRDKRKIAALTNKLKKAKASKKNP